MRSVGRTLALALAVGLLTAGAGRPRPELRVLFIGNSLTYTHDVPGMLEAMAAAGGGVSIAVSSVTQGGAGLEDHWVGGVARERIRLGGWDVVVLQQGPSATEGRPSLLEYSARFAREIRAAGGLPALYQVWPAEARAFDRAGVNQSYRMAAERVDGMLFPVGEAWLAAWRRDSTVPLYGPDRFHQSEVGSYLAAAVMYQQLTGRSPVGLPGRLRLRSGRTIEIPAAWLATVQEAATEANGLRGRSRGER